MRDQLDFLQSNYANYTQLLNPRSRLGPGSPLGWLVGAPRHGKASVSLFSQGDGGILLAALMRMRTTIGLAPAHMVVFHPYPASLLSFRVGGLCQRMMSPRLLTRWRPPLLRLRNRSGRPTHHSHRQLMITWCGTLLLTY